MAVACSADRVREATLRVQPQKLTAHSAIMYADRISHGHGMQRSIEDDVRDYHRRMIDGFASNLKDEKETETIDQQPGRQ